jgi:branched-chain amino acid transport system permease protein
MLLNILLAVSLWFIMTTGQVTLGHAGFAAIGGYVSAALITSFNQSSWLSLLVAIVTAGIVAAIIGYVTLRIKGIYFIITTLALGEVIRIVFGMWEYPFGGLVGIMNLPPPDPIVIPGLPAIKFVFKPYLYYLTLLLVMLGVIFMYKVSISRFGLVFRGISQADNLAEHIGVNIMRYKVLAFVIGSMCASLAGVLYTYCTSCILLNSFTLVQSTYYLVYVAVGGGANIFGPILGATVLSVLSELLRPIKDFEPIIYGLLMIGMVLLFRGGLFSLVQILRQTFLRLIKSSFVPIKKPV